MQLDYVKCKYHTKLDYTKEMLKEGYLANAKSGLEICEDFKYADYVNGVST